MLLLSSSASFSQNRLDPIVQSVKCERSKVGYRRSLENGYLSISQRTLFMVASMGEEIHVRQWRIQRGFIENLRKNREKLTSNHVKLANRAPPPPPPPLVNLNPLTSNPGPAPVRTDKVWHQEESTHRTRQQELFASTIQI